MCNLTLQWTPYAAVSSKSAVDPRAALDITVSSVGNATATTFYCPLQTKTQIPQSYRVLISLIPLIVVFYGILGLRLSSRCVRATHKLAQRVPLQPLTDSLCVFIVRRLRFRHVPAAMWRPLQVS